MIAPRQACCSKSRRQAPPLVARSETAATPQAPPLPRSIGHRTSAGKRVVATARVRRTVRVRLSRDFSWVSGEKSGGFRQFRWISSSSAGEGLETVWSGDTGIQIRQDCNRGNSAAFRTGDLLSSGWFEPENRRVTRSLWQILPETQTRRPQSLDCQRDSSAPHASLSLKF
jgi:hypothetical protein